MAAALTIYNSAIFNEAKGLIDYDTDTVYAMLVGEGYTVDKDAHDYRNDITSEPTGAGYTSGGASVSVTVTQDNTNDRTDITLGAVSWPTSTLVARGIVYYKRRGGASSADELICHVDFGSTFSTVADTFNVAAQILRKQNLT